MAIEVTEIYCENAVLVGLITPQQKEAKAREYIDELAFLADTAGAHVVKTFFKRWIILTLAHLWVRVS